MGASLGLALGSEKSEEDEQCKKFDDCVYKESYTPGPFDVVEEYSAKEISKKLYSSFDDTYAEEEEDDVEILNEKPYLNEDGVLVKETTEGLVEVTDPYVISADEFNDPNIFTEFESNTLIYYEGDDVLATDRDEVIVDVEESVGPNALSSFGYMAENKDVVYVRNLRLGCNFEVLREEGSYKELVLGLPEDDDYEKARKFFKNLDEKEYVGDNIGGRD